MKTKASVQHQRCFHRTACGRRCRKPASGPESRFCELHHPSADASPQLDLSATLTAGLDKFDSPAAINAFLSRLLLLLSQNLISPRRAAVLAYITNQILRTISAIEQRAAEAQPANRPVQIVWDIPSRDCEREPPPTP